ncbi:related to peroxisomal serine-active lipase [Phialocephala subalpina]|uniref:Related to peroxisomal serine-active lipase n=1 Tax=Phialocephala subalpina TaxID=576137 RepID=A0A1L7WWV7_9HELO|nr:related to peroxisomal serine-active lipase [Phialocephala subalpina]
MRLALLLSCLLFVFVDIARGAQLNNSFTNGLQSQVSSRLRWLYPNISKGRFNLYEMTQIVALCSILLPGWWLLRRKQKYGKSLLSGSESPQKAEASDPGLLKKHTEFKFYTTSRFTYPKIRVFSRPHPQIAKLPSDPAPLPLLVFIHGLGGSVAQFHPLLTSLVNNSSCLAIDFPGCGVSSFAPKAWDAYTTESLAELLEIIVEDYRDKDAGQGVVLIGHSMGCSLGAMLASRNCKHYTELSDHVVGLVAVCPVSGPPSEAEVNKYKKLLCIPDPVFNAWRRWDRRGGVESASVNRFVGVDSDVETKRLQYRFNEQSKTPVWRRMARGSLPHYHNGVATGGLPGREVWAGLEVPVFLVAGDADNVTKPVEIEKIAAYLGKSHPIQIEVDEDSKPIVDAAAPIDSALEKQRTSSRQIDSIRDEDFLEADPNTIEDALNEDAHDDPSTPNDGLSVVPPQAWRPKKILKTTILPAPASHALIYQPAQVRILAGLISDFLCRQVSPRLDLGWQLRFLSTSGKWDVKNLEKWKKVTPVSEPIAGVFRAMKTLREVDEVHCPKVFVDNWGSQIKDIIDISHESPVYDPRGLEKGGVHYHKFPTVSKIPPTGDEVTAFIALVDRLIEEQKVRAEKEGWADKHYIGVHCHYGFNRTGYFIVCYLVERLGYDVQVAIDEFARQRPKGIKHAHFLDQLFVRFCRGLKRAPTL